MHQSWGRPNNCATETPARSFVADDNHGVAAQYTAVGGPAAKVNWADRDKLDIKHSRGARIFLQISQSGETHIDYSPF
jgi:hypothetical protein